MLHECLFFKRNILRVIRTNLSDAIVVSVISTSLVVSCALAVELIKIMIEKVRLSC